MAIMC